MPKMEELKFIRYRFLFNEDAPPPKERIFTVFLEKASHDLVQPVHEDKPLPEWTRLGFSKCRSCPLAENEYQHCPPARAMVDLVEFFADLPSYQEAHVVVETDRRTISAKTTVQEGLRSLMGLIMPTSGCPVLSKLKPMTYVHLPFSSLDETTFRSVSAHLLGQYFVQRYGGKPTFDLENLSALYKQIHQVNLDFLERLRAASTNDATLNSLISLDVFALSVPHSIDSALDKFLPLFLDPEQPDETTSSCRK